MESLRCAAPMRASLDRSVSDFYGTDLAHVHDEGFGFLAREGAACLLRLLNEAAFEDGLVVDVACGSGIATEILLRAGYAVHGIDASPEMLAIARARAPAAELVCSPLIDAELPHG